MLVTGELPTGRHLYGIPFFRLACGVAVFKKGKIPQAVKQGVFRLASGDIVASLFQPVQARFFGVLIITLHDSLLNKIKLI